jgi:Fe-S cluster biogenesis protein NfuA
LTNTTKWHILKPERTIKINPKINKEKKMKEQVQSALNEIRPSLQADGGDVELVDVEDGIVKVRLTGACGGCPMSQMTLKQGIEAYVKKKIPQIVSVESV